MRQRSGLSLLTLTLSLLGVALSSAFAKVDRSDSSLYPPPATPLAALRAADAPAPKAATAGRRFAHAIIVRTSPEKGAAAPQTIGKVEVWYDAGIRDDFVALAVINAAGDRVDKRDAAIDSTDQSHVSTSVEALSPGEYTVRYRAISADGHPVSGAFAFEVGPK
jgi:methionine-rich copper-binding protein CopC